MEYRSYGGDLIGAFDGPKDYPMDRPLLGEQHQPQVHDDINFSPTKLPTNSFDRIPEVPILLMTATSVEDATSLGVCAATEEAPQEGAGPSYECNPENYQRSAFLAQDALGTVSGIPLGSDLSRKDNEVEDSRTSPLKILKSPMDEVESRSIIGMFPFEGGMRKCGTGAVNCCSSLKTDDEMSVGSYRQREQQYLEWQRQVYLSKLAAVEPEMAAVKLALVSFRLHEDNEERRKFLKPQFDEYPDLRFYFTYSEVKLKEALVYLEEDKNYWNRQLQRQHELLQQNQRLYKLEQQLLQQPQPLQHVASTIPSVGSSCSSGWSLFSRLRQYFVGVPTSESSSQKPVARRSSGSTVSSDDSQSSVDHLKSE